MRFALSICFCGPTLVLLDCDVVPYQISKLAGRWDFVASENAYEEWEMWQ